MKKLWLLALLPLIACSPSFLNNAYIEPDGDCGYIVKIGAYEGKDQRLSQCMSLEDARNLAAQINKDMGNKWSGRPR